MLGLPEEMHACLFDLDGVLTDTASVHKKAWKVMFDAYLRERAERTGEEFVPFDPRCRLSEVRGRQAARGWCPLVSRQPWDRTPGGHPDDAAGAETVHGLGNRKNELFTKTLREDGVEVFDGSRRYLEAVAEAGLGTAVVSSSANTRDVLEVTGLDRFVQQRVDGVTMREEHIPGKPAPDSFLRAAQLLDVAPREAAVFEDALAGVAAGRAGNFGLVVGVDRVGQSDALRRNGADIVVTDLAELLDAR